MKLFILPRHIPVRKFRILTRYYVITYRFKVSSVTSQIDFLDTSHRQLINFKIMIMRYNNVEVYTRYVCDVT